MSENGYVGKRIDELPQLWDGFAKLVREGCDITAFGVQIMDLPPDYETKSHDETSTGQQELYMGLTGSGALIIDDGGERLTLDSEHVARVDAGTSRTLSSGPDGLRVLCIGGIPGAPYEVPEWTHGEER